MSKNLSTEEIVRDIKESIFLLKNNDAVGTGFAVGSDGHILTCDHVLNTDTIEVVSANGKYWMASVLASDKKNDLAFLKIDNRNVPPIVFADPISIAAGQRVYLGHPFGFDFTVSQGIISNKNRLINGTGFIQIDVPLNPGNSGGPVINEKGEVIGMIDWIVSASTAQGLGFAISIRHIFAFAAQLRITLKNTNILNILSNTSNKD